MADESACALSSSGRIYCWGPYSLIVDPSQDLPWEYPRRVFHLEPARAIALRANDGAGGGLCVIGTDDIVRCHVQDPDPKNPPRSVQKYLEK
jgi:hypothetical protein